MHHQCFVTIGTESSFSIWLSMNPDAKHFVFGRFQGSEITGSRKYRLSAEKFSYSYFGFRPKLTQRTKFLIKDYDFTVLDLTVNQIKVLNLSPGFIFKLISNYVKLI